MKKQTFPAGTEIICTQLCQWRNRRFRPGDKTVVKDGEVVPIDYFEPVTAIPVELADNPWADLGKWVKRGIDSFRAFLMENGEQFPQAPEDVQARARDKWEKLSAGKPWPLDYKKPPEMGM